MADELEKSIRKLFTPIIVFNGFEDITTKKIILRVMKKRLSDMSSKTVTDYEAMSTSTQPAWPLPYRKGDGASRLRGLGG